MDHVRSFLETRRVAILAAIVLAGVSPVTAQPGALADLHGLTPRQVKTESFTLPVAQDVRIEAVGAESTNQMDKFSWITSMWQRDARRPVPPWSGNAWILDLNTRKVVWELSASATSRGARGAREFTGNVRLPAGSYTAYYAAFPDGEYWTDEDGKTRSDRTWHWFGDEPVADFKLIVRGNGQPLGVHELERLRQAAAASAIVALRGTSREQFQQSGFTLSKPTEVEVHAEGEAREDGEFDFGWIINANTRANVWNFTWHESEPAGGAEKNRVAKMSRVLPAGRYAAFYATDDSHDPSEWNTQPPHDPDAWGLTISVKDSTARAEVKTFAYEHVPQSATILALTRIGNGASKKQGFTLSRPMDVQVYALGEGRDGRMYDYGWIEDAKTGRRVWEMTYRITQHAGGATKNRRFDGTIRLPAGEYVVRYETDGSHGFGEWNAAPPDDPEAWGITIYRASH